MEENETQSIDLPGWYKDFIAAYPTDLASEFFDLGWEKEYISKRQLLADWSSILELNLDLRRNDGTQWYHGGPWPSSHLAIGDDRCGNYWCLKLGTDERAIYFYDHELGEFEQDHDSIHGFVSDLLSQAAAFREQNA